MVREAYSQPNDDWEEDDWQKARDEVRDLMENIAGPVVGHFTLTRAATTGSHPEAVRLAWVGVALPVREDHEDPQSGNVQVLCSDAFNALVEAEKDESVLQYWIDRLNGAAGPEATFAFERSDGTYAEKE